MFRNSNVIPIDSKSTVTPKVATLAPAALARLPAPVHQCRQILSQQLRKDLLAVFDAADDALFELADKAGTGGEQNLYFESMRELRLQRQAVITSYLEQLDHGFAPFLSEKSPQESEVEVNAETLSLMGHEQIERQVAIETMAQRQDSACKELLQQLSIRFDALVPGKVYAGNNPIRAIALCSVFGDVVAPLQIDIRAQLLLLKLFDKLVLGQYRSLLVNLNDYLISQDILPSLKTSVTPRPGRRSGSEPAPVAESPAANHSAQPSVNQSSTNARAQQGQYATAAMTSLNAPGDMLAQYQQLVHGASGSLSSEAVMASGLAQAQPITAEYLYDITRLLSEMQHSQLASMAPSAEMAVLNAEAFTQHFKQHGVQVAGVDNDVINLVTLLFEFILDDRTLAPTMKALLARLQIPLVKVALQDKNFFAKQGHPARRLLNELAAAALSWQEPSDESLPDPLKNQIEIIINRVLREFDENVELFSELLTDFLAFNERERRRASIIEKRTLDAEQGKAAAERARSVVDSLMQAKLNEEALPDVVTRLLLGPWSNLLFLICLRNGEGTSEWNQSVAVVDDLIWSVSASLDLAGRKRLLTMLPALLGSLREGLSQVSYNPYETSQIFSALEQCHLHQLKPASESSARPKAPQAVFVASDLTPLDKLDANKAGTASASGANTRSMIQVDVTVADAEDQAAEVVATTLTAVNSENSNPQAITSETQEAIVTVTGDKSSHSMAEQLTAATTPLTTRVEPDQAFLFQVDQLAQGSWLDMTASDGSHCRCRLAAIIRAADKYIFVNRSGVKVAEKTRVEIALALQNQQLILLENGQMFERALESVIGGLRHTRV